MSYYTSNDDEDLYQKHQLQEQYAYSIAFTVLYALAFVAGAVLFVLVLAKLQGLTRTFSTILKTSCVFLLLEGLCSIIYGGIFWEYSRIYLKSFIETDEYIDYDRISLVAAGYISIIGTWMHAMTQSFTFLAVVGCGVWACSARNAVGAAHRGLSVAVVNIAYALTLLLVGAALVSFSLNLYTAAISSYYAGYDDSGTILASPSIRLAFRCLATFAALYAIGVSASATSKSQQKPAKLAVGASVLLLLSTVYALAIELEVSWITGPFGHRDRYGYYISVLTVIFGVWPLVGAIGLLYAAGNSCLETAGAPGKPRGNFVA